ncbi:MAG: glycosyltransferase family 4 protein [Elusimicrobiota bacterium]
MKVLHIITRLDPGGSSKMCLQISNMLQKKGVKSYIAGGISLQLPKNVIPVRFLKREICPVMDLTAVLEIFLLCKKIKPDVLHLHTSKAGFVGRIAGYLAGVERILYQPHGIVFYGYFSKFKSMAILITEKLLAPLAKNIIVLSPKAKEEFLSYRVGKEKQYRVLENGVRPSNFVDGKKNRRKLRKKVGIKEKEIVFGMAGRLVTLKGHKYFIKAFAKLSKKREGIKAVIIGGGPEEKKLKKFVKKFNLGDKVVFTGYRQNMEKAIHLMDVLVQPSMVEGFGLTLIEAGAAKIPAIGFKVGGISDIIVDNITGFLIEKKSVSGIYQAMDYFTENPEKIEEMGGEAKKRVKEKYTLNKMQKRLYEIYGVEK